MTSRTNPVEGRSRQVLFVQGGGANVHDSWDNKLVASLREALGAGYTIHYPRMPEEADPDAVRWKEALAHELSGIPERVILVAHSVGAAILLDYLGHPGQGQGAAGVFLIAAPYIGEGGWQIEAMRPTRELALAIDDAMPLTLYQGTRDDVVPVSHIGMLAKAFPRARVRRLEGRDHQLDNDLSEVAHDIKRLH